MVDGSFSPLEYLVGSTVKWSVFFRIELYFLTSDLLLFQRNGVKVA